MDLINWKLFRCYPRKDIIMQFYHVFIPKKIMAWITNKISNVLMKTLDSLSYSQRSPVLPLTQ